MKTFQTIHNEAMDFALLADSSQRRGDKEEAERLFGLAFDKESEAAYLAEELGNPEPGLSILFRSAAWLGVNCGRLKEAEKIAIHALNRNGESAVAEELRDVLKHIYNLDTPVSDSEESFKLNVPKNEESLFKTLMDRMGWTFSAMKRAGHVAAL